MRRYMEEEGAAAYRRKYERSLLRRLSSRREMALVDRAFAALGARGESLDAPCGAGRLVPVLLRRAERVVGLDASPAMLAQAKAALVEPIAEGRVRLEQGSVAALPFADAAFDGAVCWRLLHHLTDPASRLRALSELRRVSRRGVVVSFSDAGTLKARLRAWRRGAPRTVTMRASDLAAEASACGLRLERTWRLAGAFSPLAAALLLPS